MKNLSKGKNKERVLIWNIMSEHEHKVNETKKRSLLKGISMRVLEVTVDTILLSILGLDIHVSIGVSIAIEGICFAVHFVNERLWNHVQWGRQVVEMAKTTQSLNKRKRNKKVK